MTLFDNFTVFRFESATEVHLDCSTLWKIVSDPALAHEFPSFNKVVERIDFDGPVEIDCDFRMKLKFGPTIHGKVITFEPDKKWGLQYGPLFFSTLKSTYVLHPIDDQRTKLVIESEIISINAWIYKIFKKIIVRAADKEMQSFVETAEKLAPKLTL